MISYTEEKNLINIAKHGLDLSIAEDVLAGITVTVEDTREAYDEVRYQTLGLHLGVVVVLVIHTPRQDTDHIISVRKATKHEQDYYWRHSAY